LLQSATGDTAGALGTAQEALALAEKYASATPTIDLKIATLGGAWAVLARVQSTTQQISTARQSAEKAQTIWDSIHNPGLLTAYRAAIAANQVALSQTP